MGNQIRKLLIIILLRILNSYASEKYHALALYPDDSVVIHLSSSSNKGKAISAQDLLKTQCPTIDAEYDNICTKLLSLLKPAINKESRHQQLYLYKELIEIIDKLDVELKTTQNELQTQYSSIINLYAKDFDDFNDIIIPAMQSIGITPIHSSTIYKLAEIYQKFFPDSTDLFAVIDNHLEQSPILSKCISEQYKISKIIACTTLYTNSYYNKFASYLINHVETLYDTMQDLNSNIHKIFKYTESLSSQHAALLYLQYASTIRAKSVKQSLYTTNAPYEIVEENFDTENHLPFEELKEPFYRISYYDQDRIEELTQDFFLSNITEPHESPISFMAQPKIIFNLLAPFIAFFTTAFIMSFCKINNHHKRILLSSLLFLSAIFIPNTLIFKL